MADKEVQITGEKCPVCKKRTVAIVGQAGDLPITLCLNCDNKSVMSQLSRWARLEVRIMSLWDYGELIGYWATMLYSGALASLYLLVVTPDEELAIRIFVAVGGALFVSGIWWLHRRAITGKRGFWISAGPDDGHRKA